MHKELFSIGPVTLNSFGLMLAIGIIAAIAVGMKRAEKYGLDKEVVFDLGIVCIISGILGAKILYVILEYNDIIESSNWLGMITTGFIIYGGIIGGVIGLILYCRFKKLPVLKYTDLVVPSLSIGQAFGRIGCFLAGCCYGAETNNILGITFPESAIAPSGVKLLPTQLFSSAGDFIIAVILILAARRSKRDGGVTGLYFILYGIGRFIIEIFRNDPRGSVGILSTSQFISIFSVLIGILVQVLIRRKTKISVAK